MTPRLVALYRRAQDLILPERAIVRRFIATHLADRTMPRLPCLDIGAGPDPYGAALSQALGPDTPIITADIGPGDRVQAMADVQFLPFADRTFAAVIASHLLQHVEDPRAALAEIARVLAPGGVVLVIHPFVTLQGRHRDLWRWTSGGMALEARRAGLTPIAQQSVGGPLYAVADLLASLPGRLLTAHSRGWRSGRGPVESARLALAFALAVPFHILARIGGAIDRALWPDAPFYVGGVTLARKDGHG